MDSAGSSITPINHFALSLLEIGSKRISTDITQTIEYEPNCMNDFRIARMAELESTRNYISMTLPAKIIVQPTANSEESIVSVRLTFSLVNALVYVRHRPGHSLGKKSDEHLQCSPRS